MELSVFVPAQELREIEQKYESVLWPLVDGGIPNVWQRFLDTGIEITYKLVSGELIESEVRKYGSFPVSDSTIQASQVAYDVISQHFRQVAIPRPKSSDIFPNKLYGHVKDRLYFFNAERFNISESETSPQESLKSDASNLPQVLNLLQTKNPARFRKLEESIRLVLPQIGQITVPPVKTDTVRILVWDAHIPEDRDDLAIPLSESGTGIGQVLAMLYVVLNSNYPRILIIDEPQSFLHPDAVRKLFDIFKQHPQHQYIIATHSPVAVSAAGPHQLLLVHKEGAESKVDTLDAHKTEELRLVLSEVGARLSDVFGADSILWVEGRTEEECFPLIVSELLGQGLYGVEIRGVESTGDFDGRKAELVIRIYEQLSKGGGLLPPAVGFIFDREGKTEAQRERLDELGRARFLEFAVDAVQRELGIVDKGQMRGA